MKRAIKKIFMLFKRKNYIPINVKKDEKNMLEGKVAFITGGSGGIGFAIAKKFSESGAKVIISGRDEKKLKKCCKEIGDNSNYIIMDQSDIKNIDNKIEKAIEIHGKIDILVNAAGMHIAKPNLSFLNTLEEEYDEVMNLNLKSTYFITQKVVKDMISKKIKGHVLMISSQSALEPSWSPYRLSKLGLNGITRGFAQELLQYGIIVNGIAPGPTATNMQAFKQGDSIYTDQTKLERYTMPEEVAEYAIMLVSDLGNTIIGDIIYMSGGRGIIDIR